MSKVVTNHQFTKQEICNMRMAKIFSPERNELQDAFANQFRNIVRRRAKRRAFLKAIKDYVAMFAIFLLAIAFFLMLIFVWSLSGNG